jgi:hypothetical protein
VLHEYELVNWLGLHMEVSDDYRLTVLGHAAYNGENPSPLVSLVYLSFASLVITLTFDLPSCLL